MLLVCNAARDLARASSRAGQELSGATIGNSSYDVELGYPKKTSP